MQIRDGPAAVRGVARPPKRHWPPGDRSREGSGRGSPESEDLPPPPYRTPRGRRIRGTTFVCSRGRCRPRSRARRYDARRHRHGARRRKDPADLRIGAGQGRCAQCARCTRRGEHARRVLLRAHVELVRHLRQPDRQVPRRPAAPAGCSRSTASRRRSAPTRSCSRTATRCSGTTPPSATPAARTTLSLKARQRTATRSPSFDDAGKSDGGSRSAAAASTAGGSKAGANGRACVGKHVGLVRAYAVGAVRSNAVK